MKKHLAVWLLCLVPFLSGCLHTRSTMTRPPSCEVLTLSRSDWAIVRAGQEKARAHIEKLRADIAACNKARLVEQERERRLREELARSHTPWMVIVVVVAVAGVAGVVGVALAK